MTQFDEILVSVWRQALLEDAEYVHLGNERFKVKTTSKRNLRQIDFIFDGRELRGLEQNRETKSRWAKMAREGKTVMQFVEGGKYVAVVVDGEVKAYG